MTSSRALKVQLGLLGFSSVYTLVMASRLPDIVPTHWGLNGQPDAWGSKWVNLLFGPVPLVLMVFLWWFLPKISPKNFALDTFRSTYNYVMVLCSLMMAAMHVVIVQSSIGTKWDIGQVLMAVMFAFFALMGNVLGRVKRNFWMGIKTPWTLSSERVWDATHRAAGKLWLVGGIAGFLLALVWPNFMVMMVFLLVISFIPVFQSYFIYRKLEG